MTYYREKETYKYLCLVPALFLFLPSNNAIWFYFNSLLNDISSFVGHLKPKAFFKKDSNGIIYP